MCLRLSKLIVDLDFKIFENYECFKTIRCMVNKAFCLFRYSMRKSKLPKSQINFSIFFLIFFFDILILLPSKPFTNI